MSWSIVACKWNHWDAMFIFILWMWIQQKGWLIFVIKMDKCVLVLHEIFYKIHASYVLNVSVNGPMDKNIIYIRHKMYAHWQSFKCILSFIVKHLGNAMLMN
eukprot:530470_1